MGMNHFDLGIFRKVNLNTAQNIIKSAGSGQWAFANVYEISKEICIYHTELNDMLKFSFIDGSTIWMNVAVETFGELPCK